MSFLFQIYTVVHNIMENLRVLLINIHKWANYKFR